MHNNYNSKSSLTLLELLLSLPTFHTAPTSYFCGLCSLLNLYNHLVVHATNSILLFFFGWILLAKLHSWSRPTLCLLHISIWVLKCRLTTTHSHANLTSIHGSQSQGTLMLSIRTTSFPRPAISNMVVIGYMWLLSTWI